MKDINYSTNAFPVEPHYMVRFKVDNIQCLGIILAVTPDNRNIKFNDQP